MYSNKKSSFQTGICPRDGALTGTIILDPIGPASNGNKDVLHILQIFLVL